jgi:putative membrane protein
MWIKRNYSPAKGVIAGAIGGLFASLVMNEFQAGIKKLSSRSRQENDPSPGASGQPRGAHYRRPEQNREEESATVKTAVAVSEHVFHHRIEPGAKQTAGQLVHYVYGVAFGAIYGWAAERSPVSRLGFGTLFGAALWFAGDEIGVPMLGLAKKPQEYPASVHVSALAAHLVYGATTEFVRRSLRRGYLSS